MTGPAAGHRPLVVGLGNPDRGDDGVGAAVLGRVCELAGEAVESVAVTDPTDLVDLFDPTRAVVVVDALRSGGPPGAVCVLDARAEPLPAGGSHSTRGFGLATSVELARALGRLPRRLIVVGVETGAYDVGASPSAAAAAAVDTAAHQVLAVCGQPIDPPPEGV